MEAWIAVVSASELAHRKGLQRTVKPDTTSSAIPVDSFYISLASLISFEQKLLHPLGPMPEPTSTRDHQNHASSNAPRIMTDRSSEDG